MKLASLLFLLTSLSVMGSQFDWPAGISTNGPYTLVSVVSNSTVFMPSSASATENDLESHKYNHHTRIAVFSNRVFIAHSSYPTNETDAGGQTVIHYSTNHGVSWSSPALVCPPQSSWQTISNCCGLDGSRIAYPRNFQILSNKLYLVSAVDQVHVIGGVSQFLVGIALMANEIGLDGTVGTIFRISPANYTNIDSKPFVAYDSTLGPPIYSYSKLYGTWGGSTPFDTQSDWIGWTYQNPYNYVEPSTFSQDGSSLNFFRLWRSISSVLYIALSTSSDGGGTWSALSDLTVPNSPSEMSGIRLMDGSFCIIGNPQGLGPGGGGRDPLFLAKSSSSSTALTNVWAIRQGISGTPTYAGNYKGGGASYNDVVQVGNYLYVSYSIQKESIGFSRVLIPGLDDNNNDFQLGSSLNGAFLSGVNFQ